MTTKQWLDQWRTGELPTEPLPAPAGVEDVAVLLAWRALLGLPDHEASQDEITEALHALADLHQDYQRVTAAAAALADDYLSTDLAASTGLTLRYRDSRDGKRPVTGKDGKVYPAIEYSGIRPSHPLRARLSSEDCYHAGGDRRVILGPAADSLEAVQPYRWYAASLVEEQTRQWEADRLEDLARRR